MFYFYCCCICVYNGFMRHYRYPIKCILYFATNCPRRIVREEPSSTNRPRRIVLWRIVRSPDSACKKYGLQINADKIKVMTTAEATCTCSIKCGNSVLEQRFGGHVWMSWIINHHGWSGVCNKKIRSRLAKGYAITKQLKIWGNHGITMATKWKLLKVLLVGKYGCENSPLRKAEETRINVFEMKCLRFVLWISWTEQRTNEWVLQSAGT